MKEHDSHSIRKVTAYVDGGGREIREFEQIFGKNKEENSYVGVALVVMKAQHPVTGQTVSKHDAVEFPIEGVTSIKKAFEVFDAEAKKEIELRQKQAQDAQKEKNLIAMPGGKGKGILGADGAPVGG